MSSRERTLILKLDDSQVREAIKKIEEAGLGTKSGGGSSTKQSKGLEGIAKIFTTNSVFLKNIAKLTLIAAAITAILAAIQKIADRIVDSSPILQTMLKLMQVGITFILRPIGDFIAFFLRPFIIFFLRNIALPMYRTWDPIMRTLGTFLGKNLFSNLTLQYDPDIDPFFGTTGVFTLLGQKFAEWQAQLAPIKFPSFQNISDQINLLRGKLSDSISNVFSTIGSFGTTIFMILEGTKNFIGLIGLRINEILSPILPVFGGIANFFSEILVTINDIFNTTIVPKLTEFSQFIVSIIDQAREPVDNAIASIGEFFRTIADFFNTLIESINSLIFSIPLAIGGLFGGGSTGPTTVTQNFFEGSIQAGQDVVDQIFNFGEQVGKSINETLSGKVS